MISSTSASTSSLATDEVVRGDRGLRTVPLTAVRPESGRGAEIRDSKRPVIEPLRLARALSQQAERGGSTNAVHAPSSGDDGAVSGGGRAPLELLGPGAGPHDHGGGYPTFIEDEFRSYLSCGILAHGFARVVCSDCRAEDLVAFSCKRRVCPSCTTRRMNETAAQLCDYTLPPIGYRQWTVLPSLAPSSSLA